MIRRQSWSGAGESQGRRIDLEGEWRRRDVRGRWGGRVWRSRGDPRIESCSFFAPGFPEVFLDESLLLVGSRIFATVMSFGGAVLLERGQIANRDPAIAAENGEFLRWQKDIFRVGGRDHGDPVGVGEGGGFWGGDGGSERSFHAPLTITVFSIADDLFSYTFNTD